MTLRRKILLGVMGTLGIAVVALAATLSYNAECGTAAAAATEAGAPSMRAVRYRCYGPPAVLRLEVTPRPVPADNQVLVRVHAAAVNPLDWHFMRGEPYVMRLSSGLGRPAEPQLGVDFAGTIEAVGRDVTRFKPGDAVFGGRNGAFAEYLAVRADRAVVLKPDNVSFEEAAAVPVAAITALQAVRDKGRVQRGQRVLVNGASGGVGTYAVQIAKAYGAEVTGVSSTRNLELVRSLGADHVIDYTRQNFTEGTQRYDVIIDNVGSQSLLAYRRVLTPEGVVVMVGSTSRGAWLGPLSRPLVAMVLSPFVSQKFEMLLSELNPADMATLRELLESGRMRSVIDRRYSLADVPAAIEYLESGRARGKVVIDVTPPPAAR